MLTISLVIALTNTPSTLAVSHYFNYFHFKIY